MTAPLKRKDIIQAIITNPKLNEEEKSLLVEEFVNEIKNQYPELKYHTTKTDLSEVELKLIKEIEDTRKEIKELDNKLTTEIKELDLKLTKEIKGLDNKLTKEIKELDNKLTKEIKELDLKLTKEIKETKSDLLKWSFLFWSSQLAALIGIGFFVYKALNLH